MLSEENFVEMESTMTMMVFNNLINRKTHDPSAKEINEPKNVDINSSWEGDLQSPPVALLFPNFSMVPQDQQSLEDVFKKYMKN